MSNDMIREVCLSDAPAIQEIYRYYVENTAITFEYETPSIKEFERRITHTLERYPYLVIERAGRLLGYAYASALKEREAYDWSCELSIYLDRDAQKQGLGKMLEEALEKKLCQMGILNAYACIAVPNVDDEYLNHNSAQFHEHRGYKMVGYFHQCGYKFGRWYDMIWMEKMLGSHDAKPQPLPFQK